MKRRAWLLVLLLVLCLSVPVRAASSSIGVRVNGAAISFPVPPRNFEGRVLVPMREIFEALGATLVWDGATNSVHATAASGLQVDLQIGNKLAQADGQLLLLDVPPQLIDGRTLVPVRFVAEAMGATVAWEQATETVVITAGAPTGAPLHTGRPNSRAELLERALAATVMMEGASIDAGDLFASGEWLASGFFLNNKGLVATNYHVMTDALGPQVLTHDGKKFQVLKVIAASKAADLAIVETDAVGYPALPLSLHEGPSTGEGVLAIGNPLGEHWTVTEGSVTAPERTFEGRPWIEHTATLNKGNSGGPLISTSSGRVLGMNTLILTNGAGQKRFLAAPGTTIGDLLSGALPSDPIITYLPSPTGPTSSATDFPPTTVAGEWNHYWGDPGSRSYSPVSPGLQLQPLWQYDYGISAPNLVLAHGILFGTDNSSGGNVYAFDPATGKILWKDALGEDSSPPVAGPQGFYIASLEVLVHYKPDGTRAWERPFPWARQVHLVDGKLLVAGNGMVTAFDPVTGAELWSTKDLGDMYDPQVRLAAGDGKVVVPLSSRIFVLEIKTGKVLYTLDRGLDVYAPAPVIDAGLLYIRLGQTIEAYDLSTGKRLWQVKVGESILAKPTVGNGVLVVEGSDQLKRVPGHTYGYDSRTGVQLWVQPRPIETGGSATIVGSHLFTGGEKGLEVRKLATGELVTTLLPGKNVYGDLVATADTLYVPDRHFGLYALRRDPAVPAPGPTSDWDPANPPPIPQITDPKAKGEWLHSLGDPGNRNSATTTGPGFELEIRWQELIEYKGPMVLTEGTLFVMNNSRGKLYAVNALTGERRWQKDWDDWSMPVAGPKGLYLSGEGGTTLLNRDGTQVWHKEVGGSNPLLIDGKLLLQSDGKAVALNPETGDELWSTPVSVPLKTWERRDPAAGNGRMVLPDVKATHVLDVATGKELYTIEQGATLRPMVDGNLLYLGSESSLYAFDLATGKEVWRAQVGAKVSQLGGVGSGMLVVTAQDGTTYAYNALTGAKVWSGQVGGNAKIVGEYLYTGGRDGLQVWKLATGERVTTFLSGMSMSGLAIATDDMLFVSSDLWGLNVLQKKP